MSLLNLHHERVHAEKIDPVDLKDDDEFDGVCVFSALLILSISSGLNSNSRAKTMNIGLVFGSVPFSKAFTRTFFT